MTVSLRGSIEAPQKLKIDCVNDLAILIRHIFPQVYRKITLNTFLLKENSIPFLFPFPPSRPLYLFQSPSQIDSLFILIIAIYIYIYVHICMQNYIKYNLLGPFLLSVCMVSGLTTLVLGSIKQLISEGSEFSSPRNGVNLSIKT